MENKARLGLSTLITAVVLFVTAYFVMNQTALGTSDAFHLFYSLLLIAGSVYVTIQYVLDVMRSTGVELAADSGFVAEVSEYKPLSQHIAWPLIIFFILTVFTLSLVSNNQGALFSQPYPYGDTLSSQQATAGYGGTWQDVFLGAVVPAIGEDAVILGIIFTLFLFTKGMISIFGGNEDITDNVVSFTLLAVVFAAIGAFIFSTAHARYGANEAATAWAFLFSFVTQLTNLLTGTFLSPIVHFAHNFIVLQNQWFSIVLFNAFLPFVSLAWWKNQWVLLQESFGYWKALWIKDWRRLTANV